MPAPPAYTRRGQPLPGPSSLPTEDGQAATYDTLGQFEGWVTVGGVTDHGELTGLSDDDHTQYALLAGRAGGQTLIGGTGSGDDLTLSTTSHATKGTVQIDGQTDGGTGARLTVPVGIYTPGFVWAMTTVRIGNAQMLPANGSLAGMRFDRVQIGSGGPYLDQASGKLRALTNTGADGEFRMRIENFTTAARPTAGSPGRVIYDTTLGKPLWDNGTQWTDATGAIV